MIAHSWEDTPVEVAMPPVAETRTVEGGGMTIAFERLAAGVETAPLFRGLPDDACQSPHWGYVLTGRLRVVATGGDEVVLHAGQAYYLAPGHNVVVEEDCELVEFSPAQARAATMEHAARALAAQGA
ncbi:MAG: hypothetical protein AB1416_14055 [Actinomycetota bacterium]